MAQISYRPPTEADIPSIQKVALVAWRRAYRGIYSPSTIRRKVEEFYSTDGLISAVRASRRGEAFFLLAIEGSEVVGYANGRRIRAPWRNPLRPEGRSFKVSGWELTRIYLLPDRIGRGIGRGLLERWESFLRTKKAKRYFVSYNSRNRLAREFYRRNGLVRAREYDDGSIHSAVKAL
jgi:GNAT superfamily N-acetyltransferase